jgi:hypothetical protein
MIERTSATERAASVLRHGRCEATIQQANIQPPRIQETDLA